MVDFGLKLEDNKVADWSEYYIRYEVLKVILKKCEAAVKRYEELAQRQPETSAIVADAFRRGVATPTSLLTETLDASSDSRTASSASLLSFIAEEQPTELTTELSRATSPTDYGSLRSINNATTPPSNVVARVFARAASDVSGYFYERYEKKLREGLQNIDKLESEFGETLLSDIRKVNEFYRYKVDELEEQILYLRESVQPAKDGQIHHRIPSEMSSEVDENNTTPLISSVNRKSAPSPIRLVRKIASFRRKFGKEIGHSFTVDPLYASDNIDDDEEVLDDETLKKMREAESVQRALVDYYRTAKLLQNFVIMNYTGFVKIVKKHGKTVPKEKGGKYKNVISAANICNEGKEVDVLVNRMERLYAGWFCDRNITEARAQILIKKGDGLEMDWSQLRLGYRMGMSAILALWVCWDCVWGLVSNGDSTIGSRTAFPVFRACAGLLQLQWCWGISVWVWSRYRVNYIFLFDFDPNIVETPLAIFNEAVDNTLFLLLCTLLYYKAGTHDIPGNVAPGIFALILVMYTLYQLIFPLKARLPMWRTILKVVTAPLASPSFFQGYVGDIFTSMVKIMQDIVWTFFFIVSGDWRILEDSGDSTQHMWAKTSWYSQILIPIVTLLPLMFRFNQCLRRYTDTGTRVPHLPNAFKYALSQLVSLFGAFHPLYMKTRTESEVFQGFWMFLFIASSLYSFTWDVFMDWGLGSRKHAFLAKTLMYPKRSMYYAIIAIDLVLRFAWVLTLIPPQSGAKFALPAYLNLVSMLLELFRRTLWGFLRLENEHRSNAAGYRRVDFVPLHFATGHKHGYKKEQTRSGFSVLIEVAGVAILVLSAAIVSVVAAQQATERAKSSEL